MTNDSMDGFHPSINEFFIGSKQTSISQAGLPRWADPTNREENFHHALRYLFESSDWGDLTVYGPETEIQDVKIDIVVKIDTVFEDASYPDVKIELDECIGIEVKNSADAFERNSNNLDQVIKQSHLESLSRVYVCTPESDNKTRLDIDPRKSRLINLLDITTTSMAFRGITGKIRQRDGTELPKTAYYKKLLSQDEEKLFDRLKKEGDLEQVERNLENIDGASISDENKNGVRGGEWRDPILKKVGILRFNVDTGEVRVQRNAEQLEYTDRESAVIEKSITEADVAHAVWRHYREQSGVNVSVEVEPPSLTRLDEPDLLERFFGEQTTRHAPRIDIVIQENNTVTGIEVKGLAPDWNRLINEQLPVYKRAPELDRLDVAVPETEVQDAKSRLQAKFDNIGLLSCQATRHKYYLERII